MPEGSWLCLVLVCYWWLQLFQGQLLSHFCLLFDPNTLFDSLKITFMESCFYMFLILIVILTLFFFVCRRGMLRQTLILPTPLLIWINFDRLSTQMEVYLVYRSLYVCLLLVILSILCLLLPGCEHLINLNLKKNCHDLFLPECPVLMLYIFECPSGKLCPIFANVPRGHSGNRSIQSKKQHII